MLKQILFIGCLIYAGTLQSVVPMFDDAAMSDVTDDERNVSMPMMSDQVDEERNVSAAPSLEEQRTTLDQQAKQLSAAEAVKDHALYDAIDRGGFLYPPIQNSGESQREFNERRQQYEADKKAFFNSPEIRQLNAELDDIRTQRDVVASQKMGINAQIQQRDAQVMAQEQEQRTQVYRRNSQIAAPAIAAPAMLSEADRLKQTVAEQKAEMQRQAREEGGYSNKLWMDYKANQARLNQLQGVSPTVTQRAVLATQKVTQGIKSVFSRTPSKPSVAMPPAERVTQPTRSSSVSSFADDEGTDKTPAAETKKSGFFSRFRR